MAMASELDLGLDTAGVLARAGVRDGQPFVLGADGSYDVAMNRFFQELDGWGGALGQWGGCLQPRRDVVLPVSSGSTWRKGHLGVRLD